MAEKTVAEMRADAHFWAHNEAKERAEKGVKMSREELVRLAHRYLQLSIVLGRSDLSTREDLIEDQNNIARAQVYATLAACAVERPAP